KPEETVQSEISTTNNDFVEFVFKKDDQSSIDYQEIEKKYQADKKSRGDGTKSQVTLPTTEAQKQEIKKLEQAKKENEKEEEEGGVEKTVLLQRPSSAKAQVDKTVIVNPQALQKLKEPEVADEPEEYEKTKKEILPEELPVDTENATQMVVLSDVMRKIKT